MPEENKPTPQPTPTPSPAPAPAAATPPPATPPAEPEVKEPEGPVKDPIMAQYVKDMGFVLDEDEPKPEPKKEEPKPEPVAAAPAPAPAPEPKPEPTPPVKVETEAPIEDVIEQTIQRVLQAQKPPEPPPTTAPPAPPVDPDAEYIATLGEPEREQIRVADYAEAHFPEMKGMKRDLVGFYRKLDEYVSKARKDDPDRTFDEGDEDFQKWIRRNQPKVSPQRLEKVKLSMVREEAVAEAEARATKKFQGEIQEVRQRQHVIETRPKVNARLRRFDKEALASLEAKDDADVNEVLTAVKTKGWQAAEEEDPLLVPLARARHDGYARRAAEFLAVTNGLKPTDVTNPDHAWLGQFIDRQAQAVLAKGNSTRIVDGRRVQFVSRAQFIATPPEQRVNFWTLTDEDVLQLLQAEARNDVLATLTDTKKRLEKGRYRREKPTPKPATSPDAKVEPAPEASPKAPTSSGPGLASASVQGNTFLSAKEASAMGLGGFIKT